MWVPKCKICVILGSLCSKVALFKYHKSSLIPIQGPNKLLWFYHLHQETLVEWKHPVMHLWLRGRLEREFSDREGRLSWRASQNLTRREGHSCFLLTLDHTQVKAKPSSKHRFPSRREGFVLHASAEALTCWKITGADKALLINSRCYLW